jgi:diguanylate cyclase (GGDEF)-like protein/PAS domain S-box-containing protein
MERVVDPTRSREFCLALIEAAPDALVVADAEGRIIIANAQAERMFGYSRDELVGQPIELLLPERLRASHEERRAAYVEAPTIRPMGIGRELLARRRDGTELPVEIALSPLDIESGHLTIATMRDATERRLTEAKLRYLGGHDTLTGLDNRHTFEEQQSRHARGRQFPVSILVIDLDGLKEINDLHGHAIGDEMLKRAAAVLVQAFRADDTVARIGGDEFAALLPSTGREAAAAAVARVVRLLRQHNGSTQGPALRLSVGAATAERGQSLAQCLREADTAMYRDKLSHEGRVR